MAKECDFYNEVPNNFVHIVITSVADIRTTFVLNGRPSINSRRRNANLNHTHTHLMLMLCFYLLCTNVCSLFTAFMLTIL